VTVTTARDPDLTGLSPQQRRIWRLQSASKWLLAGCRVRVEADVTRPALERCWETLVQKHQILSSRYRMRDGLVYPEREIDPEAGFAAAWFDATCSSNDGRDGLPGEVRSRFELEVATPTRTARCLALRVGSELTEVVLTTPALNADAPTLAWLADELGKTLVSAGEPSPTCEVEFAVVRAFQDQVAVERADEVEIHGFTPKPLPLQARHAGEFNPSRVMVPISPELGRSLAQLADEESLSTESAALSMYALLLARLTEGSVAKVGLVRNERWYAELASCPGPVSGVVPIEVSVATNDSLLETSLKVQLLAARAQSEEGRSLWQTQARGKPYPLAWQFEILPSEDGGLGSSNHRIEDIFAHIEPFTLKLACRMRGNGPQLELYYDRGSIHDKEALLIAARLEKLLRQLVTTRHVRAMATDIVSLADAEVLQANSHAPIGSQGPDVVALFEAAAAEHPTRLAVVVDDRALSYGELENAAEWIANSLALRGIGPESRVGVYMQRSPELVAAVLGICKVGAAYVPLDPEYPVERLVQITQNCGLEYAVIAGAAPLRGLELLEFSELIAPRERRATPAARSVRQALYVVHTSGSTGAPSGVVVEQGNVAAYLRNLDHLVGLRALRSMASVTTIASDLGNTALFGALCYGLTLHLLERLLVLDPDRFAERVAKCQIDCIKMTPSHLSALLANGNAGVIPERALILGGESASWDLLRTIRRLKPVCRVINHYGPTETTIGVVAGEPNMAQERWAALPPLGHPLGAGTLHVLDPRCRLLPVGGSGELYIGGHQVARGYINDPRKTAERFLPDPFDTNGGRLYRSGDRVRVLPDGSYEFLGRCDDQVKIRGHRVELGEVRAQLLRHPRVRDAAVTISQEGGNPRLMAFVVPAKTDDNGNPQFAREHIAQWRDVFTQTHGELARFPATSFTAHGWVSSYTQEQFPDAEIREQVDFTVERILSWEPRRILEVGCGTGLLMMRLAPHCQEYLGVDFVPELVDYARRAVTQAGNQLSHVELQCRAADEMGDLPDQHFDVILLNSVVQYFPDLDYLSGVLSTLVRKTKSGGRILIGDVRSLPLLEVFHGSVQLARADPGTPATALRTLLEQQVRRESELVIDPCFFRALPSRIPQLGGVSVTMKRGRFMNELTKFRYDVVLHVGRCVESAEVAVWRKWGADVVSLPKLRELLRESAHDCIGVRAVPNLRTFGDCEALHFLKSPDGSITTSDLVLRTRVAGADAVHPEDVIEAAAAEDWDAHLQWSIDGRSFFDVVLTRTRRYPPQTALVTTSPPEDARGDVESNWPLLEKQARSLVRELKDSLRAHLPEHMLPNLILALPRLPLNANGKLDVRSLPIPSLDGNASQLRVPARSPAESAVAAIWAEVLGVQDVGMEDEFFEVGGHSLLAIQIVARLRSELHRDVPLQALFERPVTPAGLARYVEALTSRGASLESPGQAEPVRTDLIPPRPPEALVPPNWAQERMLHEPDPTHPAFNVPFAFHLDGPLNRSALLESIELIIRRHESWRSRFERSQAGFVQRISDTPIYEFKELDLSSSPGTQEREAAELATRFGKARFDLTAGPLLRVVLLRLGPSRHALILSVHHIISDGWSTGIFCKELSVAYSAFRADRSPELPRLAVNYGDYSVWQRSTLSRDALRMQADFWSNELAGSDLALNLAPQRTRPSPQNYRGAGLTIQYPRALGDGLKAFSTAHGATLFMTLLGVYYVLLAKLSGDRDIIIGTPIANRTHTESESMLGCFINFLPLRLDFDEKLCFRQLLGRVRERCLAAYRNRDYPFVEIVRSFTGKLSQTRPPVFQVMFELANAPNSTKLLLEGLTLRPLQFEHGTSEFELNLILREETDGIGGWLLYRTDLFDAQSAGLLVQAYQRLCERVLAEPDLPLAEVRLEDLEPIR
jgi:amino acid adenylation domain-containing protein